MTDLFEGYEEEFQKAIKNAEKNISIFNPNFGNNPLSIKIS
jgi:hypothetical protein